MSFEEHRAAAPARVKVAVVTISDKRAEGREEDISGRMLEEELRKEGHTVVRYLLPNDSKKIEGLVRELIQGDADVIITVGGTGISSRDVTIESIKPLIQKELPGFGEMLRYLGYQKVGTPALLSRSLAGLAGGKLIFCLPGAPGAVAVGLELIFPDLTHLVKHARE
jgi:molybdenum cofactor biosynthesis protein B